MIRFIDLTNQILVSHTDDDEKHPHFAFYNTVTDKFMEFLGSQEWLSKEDFIDDFLHDRHNPYFDELGRFLNLIPENFFDEATPWER